MEHNSAKDLVRLLHKLKKEVRPEKEVLKRVIRRMYSAIERYYDNNTSMMILLRDYMSRCNKSEGIFNERNGSKFRIENIAEEFATFIDDTIEELTDMGLPEKDNINKGVTVSTNVNQAQKQNQEQRQDLHLLVDLLKESIAPYQLEELKKVAIADVPVPEKRKNLFDKIQSFGINFGASVLANMLTNPQITGLL